MTGVVANAESRAAALAGLVLAALVLGLAFLLLLHSQGNIRLALIRQQILVNLLRVIVIARQLLILFFDRRAQRHPALINRNFFLKSFLIAGSLRDQIFVLMKLKTNLANFGRFRCRTFIG